MSNQIRTFKRKLILTKAQEQQLRNWIGVCRLVYNMGLEIKIDAYNKSQLVIGRFELDSQLKDLRAEINWVNDVPFECLSNAIKRLDGSYKRFFKGMGFPNWASKKTYKSVSFRQNISISDNKIRIPKIGWLKMFKDAQVIGDIKTATIKLEPKGFFISITCANVTAKFNSENQTIGLDMGLAHFCISSNGDFISNPKHFFKYELKLRIENRSLARKKKGSNSWKKQAKRLSLLHHKIANVRKDFLHKQSTAIAKQNNIVYLEDLNVKGMSKNHNLSKHILDAGWSQFRTMLSYKTTVVAINPAYTSQTCYECGVVDKKNRISQAEFKCVGCGHINHADVNSALNIKRLGEALVRERKAVA